MVHDCDPIEESIGHLIALDREHDARAPLLQRVANRATHTIGNPGAVAAILSMVVLWIIGNYVARLCGVHAFEQFPFPDLAFVATVAAFLVALLILVTQRHADQLAEKRAKLTLQMALLNERKIAKVIELLEEQRRDNPNLPSRIDREADILAYPADALSMLGRLEDEEASRGDGDPLR